MDQSSENPVIEMNQNEPNELKLTKINQNEPNEVR